MEDETYVYLEGASGLRQRVPLSKLDEWKARQEELRKQGVTPESFLLEAEELAKKISQMPKVK